jgi:hypothetical protein
MKQRDRRPDRASLKLVVFESHTEQLVVKTEAQSASIHIEQNAKDSFLLHGLAPKLTPILTVAVSQLSNCVECIAEGVVGKCGF